MDDSLLILVHFRFVLSGVNKNNASWGLLQSQEHFKDVIRAFRFYPHCHSKGLYNDHAYSIWFPLLWPMNMSADFVLRVTGAAGCWKTDRLTTHQAHQHPLLLVFLLKQWNYTPIWKDGKKVSEELRV